MARSTGLALILLISALLALSYSLRIPLGQAPDESAHWEYVRYLASAHRLPVFRAGEGSYEFHQPPLYYALAALAGDSYRAARAVNIVLHLLVVLLTWLLAMEYSAGRRHLALGAAGVAAFLPMQVFLAATINNDVLLTLCFTGTLWLAVRMLTRGGAWGSALGLGAFAGLGLLAKTSAVMLLPVGVVALLLARRKEEPALRSLGMLAVFLGCTLALGGWWLIRNTLLYGDPLVMGAFRQAFAHTATPQYFLSRGLTRFSYGVWVGLWTFASFFGVFGNMDLFLPRLVYALLALLPLGALIGLAAAAPSPRPWQRRACLVLALTVVLLLLAFIRFNLDYFQAQARYLLPALPAFALAFAAGWERLSPPRGRTLGTLAPAAALCVVSWWAVQCLPGV